MNLFLSDKIDTDLERIFFAPLDSVIRAEQKLFETSKNILLEYGFDKITQKDGKIIYKIKVVEFYYSLDDDDKNNDDDNEDIEDDDKKKKKKHNKKVLKVPLISLIQLPLLSIKDAYFDMKVHILNIISEEGKVKAKGFLAPEGSNSEYLDANMHVRLNIKEGDMPAGITRLLATLNGE